MAYYLFVQIIFIFKKQVQLESDFFLLKKVIFKYEKIEQTYSINVYVWTHKLSKINEK